MRDLIRDLGFNYTENLYGKEKEFYLYFINSIIEEKIDWKYYNIKPEDFLNYNYGNENQRFFEILRVNCNNNNLHSRSMGYKSYR